MCFSAVRNTILVIIGSGNRQRRTILHPRATSVLLEWRAEAQGRGFAHGHEKIHSEPQTKAIDFWHLIARRCCGTNGDRSNDGASEHFSFASAVLDQWMRKHKDKCLLDASTKQYDSSIECGRQFGIPLLKKVFAGLKKQLLRQLTSPNSACGNVPCGSG